MRTKTIAIALAATMLTAAPAMAQEIDTANTFNGLYVGAVGGYSMQSNDRGSTVEFDTDNNGGYGDTVPGPGGTNAFAPGFCGGFLQGNTPASGCKGDKDRAEYYGRVGFDKRYGNWVVGALLEGGRTEAVDRTTAFSSTPRAYSFSRGIDWSAAARLRAGYTPNGGILFYATGGGAYANMKHRFDTTNTTATFTDNGKDDAWGYQVGGGVEAMITNNISIGAEYLYSDFDDKKYYVTASGGAFGAATRMRPADQGFNFHSIRGSINFRF